jgi:3'-5' exoribonuclease
LFYKLRAVYRETNYGPQLDIDKIREATEADRQHGFDELMCQPSTRFDAQEMFAELISLADQHIEDNELRGLVLRILEENHQQILTIPAATHNHHAFAGGYMEHVLSVTRSCVWLVDKYREHYPDLAPPLSKDLVVAGGILHDVGKLRELEQRPAGAVYTATGELIGHILQGRDIVREAAAGRRLDPETLLRLEHIIVSHQRLPEWGSPKPPMTPEALIVHYADDLDAKLQMMCAALADDASDGPVTSGKNPLHQKVFRGL